MIKKLMISVWVVIILAILNPVMIFLLRNYLSSISDLGTVGDFLGGSITPLLTFASTLAVIIAILMQKEELSLQRKELSSTRLEFEKQNETMNLQRFDSTFFSLISLHHQIANNIKASHDKDKNAKYQDAFRKYYEVFKNEYENSRTEEPGSGPLWHIAVALSKLEEKYGSSFKVYTQNVFSILVFIEQFNISEANKTKYAEIFSHQLSSYEKSLLIYYSLNVIKSDIRTTIIKFNHIGAKSTDLINEEHMEILYMDTEERRKQIGW